MHSPTLSELPPPPTNKQGWPWTKETLSPNLESNFPWPKVSIVTPSFNQAVFLEETIRSVLLQGYPDLEYIIVDGGSTDGSVDIIKKYSPWITYWVSEKDNGQSDAINKGFLRSSGQWFGWINSDDWYNPGALQALIRCAITQKSSFVVGSTVNLIENTVSRACRHVQPLPEALLPTTLKRAQLFDQPGCLWTREIYEQAGPLEENLYYGFDWQFFIRCAELTMFALTSTTVAFYRIHESHKTGTGGTKRKRELIEIYFRNLEGSDLVALHRIQRWLPLMWWFRELRRRYWRNWLVYQLTHISYSLTRRLFIDRHPPLHPIIAETLELPHIKQALPVKYVELTEEQTKSHEYLDNPKNNID